MDPAVAVWLKRAIALTAAGDQALMAEIHKCGGVVKAPPLDNEFAFRQVRVCRCGVAQMFTTVERFRVHGLEEVRPLADLEPFNSKRYGRPQA